MDLVSISVCNFQSMKSPVEVNSLFLKFICYITWFDVRDTGGLTNEAFTSNFIISSKQ